MKIFNSPLHELRTECHRILLTGGRLLNIVCMNRGAGMDVILKYFFILNDEIICITVQNHPRGTVPSISGLCGSAIYYENIIRDETGIKFDELVLDYGMHFIAPGEIVDSEDND